MFYIYNSESIRTQGNVPLNAVDWYLTGHWILAPYNNWCSNNSILPSGPFPDLNTYFPEHIIFENNWKLIRDEALNACKQGYASKIKNDRFFTTIADDNWKKFYIKWYSDILPEAKILCPTLCKLLSQIPNVQLAMFSILEPGGIITPHCGPSKGALRYHLGLQCPKDNDAEIVVDGVPYCWKDGEGVLFDDTYMHHVKNRSKDTTRIILFCDIIRKMNTETRTNINNYILKTLGPTINKVNNRQEKLHKNQ